jgi:mono/diheme cytochrome c family protein
MIASLAGAAALCAVIARGTGMPTTSTTTISPAAAQIEHGRYLATLGDCAACHTEKGGQAFSGGRPIDTGFGTIFSPNLTPDRETGIGSWSKDEFYRALHTGHDDAGKHLYPAFPYPWFTKVTRADVDSMKDFFDSLPAVRKANQPPQLDWWLTWRPLLAGWNLLNFDSGEFRPDSRQSSAWNRGAYIVEGLGHCGDCHTPKGYFGGANRGQALSGGYASGGHQGWFAPSLAGEQRAGLGSWSAAEIVEYLKTGSNAHAVTAGPMNEVIADSTSRFTDADLEAVAVYLKSLPPRHDEAKFASLDRQALERGQGIFTDQCAACHMHDGGGIPHVFPPLMASSAIQAREASTVIRVVLEGASVPARAGQRSYLAMPAFGRKLDNQEVAVVVNYIRNAWGNRASAVDADTVAKSRQALAASDR